MVLIRLVTLQSLLDNTRFYARHVTTIKNKKADCLSRLKVEQFRQICRNQGQTVNSDADPIPVILQDMEKIWLY